MFHYNNNNHFTFGFNGEAWREWEAVDDKFFVKYGQSAALMSWRNANSYAAQVMAYKAAKRRKDLAVCLSGGLDSQVVTMAMLDAGVPFQLWHYRTGHPFETQVAVDFAKKIGKFLNIVDIDVEKFFVEWQNKQYEVVPIIHGTYELHCWLMDQLVARNLIPVYGEGSLTRLIGQTWAVGEGHTYKTTTRHAMKMGYQVFPTFFNFTPEQIHAYVRSDFIKELAAGQLHNFSVDPEGRICNHPSFFKGDTVHHVKYKLIRQQYPEIDYVRKQVGHEHLAGADWYEHELGRGKLTTDWKTYMKKHYLRFMMFEPNKLGDYFEGKCLLQDAVVAPQSCNFWSYP